MGKPQQCFFELLQVALGVRGCLSERPSPRVWQRVYDMARKQSLLGICFVGVQRITDSDAEDYCGMDELLFLTWMGMAANVQERAEQVHEQCIRVQQMLSCDGLASCVLKGQGVASCYGDMAMLRQDGDIDVWVDAPREVTVKWAQEHGGVREAGEVSGAVGPGEVGGERHCTGGTQSPGGEESEAGELHVACELFPDTDVELHFTPSVASGRKHNKALQEWFETHRQECMGHKVGLITAPAPEFNLVYLMHHMFRHYLYEGVGLRHVMDYYMTLRAVQGRAGTGSVADPGAGGGAVVVTGAGVEASSEVGADVSAGVECSAGRGAIQQAREVVRALGMESFAGALMWVIGHVFGGDAGLGHDAGAGEGAGSGHGGAVGYGAGARSGHDAGAALDLPWEPDARRGRRLLAVIMEGGNFGHETIKYKITGWDKPWSRIGRFIRRNWYMMRDYPGAVLRNLGKKIL